MSEATFRLWRGADGDGALQEYIVDVSEGMVVLDVVHEIQASQAGDLAVRWNCKAGKCGSCSAEINKRWLPDGASQACKERTARKFSVL
jgi:succinate dehydrogenase / fumarate reductase iron-sulfur subunit